MPDDEGTFSGVSQELASEVRRTQGSPNDLFQRLPRGLTLRQLAECNVGVPQDNMEQVIEVVGYPSRQDPDALQLLHVSGLGRAGLRRVARRLLPDQEVVRET